MPNLLKDDDNYLADRLYWLKYHLWTIKKALDSEELSLEDLRNVSQMSDSDVESSAQSQDVKTSFEKLLKVMERSVTDPQEVYFINSAPIDDELITFDQEQSHYLSLIPLGISNRDSLKLYLHDMASLGLVYAQHLAINSQGVTHCLSLNKIESNHSKQQWIQARPPRVISDFNPAAITGVGLLEKLLATTLGPNEWLTDIDIERACKILANEEPELPLIYVCPFTSQDIGQRLHFAREDHCSDQPQVIYHVPFILNLGETEHRSIRDRGIHWVRMLITVDSTRVPTTISIDLSESLKMSQSQKKALESTIKKALAYQEVIGSGLSAKTYQAFPHLNHKDCNITVTGNAEQYDSHSCGYRATQGIIKDLQKKGIAANSFKPLVDCVRTEDLRDYFYTQLLGKQQISSSYYDDLNKIPLLEKGLVYLTAQEDGQYKINNDHIVGYLHHLRKPKKKNQHNSLPKKEELKSLSEQGKKFKQIENDEKIRTIIGFDENKYTLDLEKLLENSAINDQSLWIEAAFDAIRTKHTITCLTLKIPANFNEELVVRLTLELDRCAHLQSISIDGDNNQSLKDQASAIKKRNLAIKKRGLEISDQPWDDYFQALIFDLPDQDNDLFVVADDWRAIEYDKFFDYLAQHQERLYSSSRCFETKINLIGI